MRVAALAVLAACVLVAPARAARVVSLNLCTDQLLVLLAPEQVAGLSPLARDPALSTVAAAAARLPVVAADAEAVLRLDPDLVLAGEYGATAAVGVLRAMGRHVVRFGLPQDFAAIRAQLLQMAALLGVPARGEDLAARMDATLAALPRRGPARPLRAVLWEPRGYAAGPGSLGAAVLEAAGLANMAAGGMIGLEAMAARPPDLLVVPETPATPSLATDLLLHPAVRAIPRRTLPPALLACAGPFTATAAALLAARP